MKGLVIKKTRSQIIVEEKNSSQQYEVVIKGTLRKDDQQIYVGDCVEFDLDQSLYVIQKIHPRKNIIIRPKVANIDTIFVVQSTIQPNYNEQLIDKMLIFYQISNVNVQLIITKTDLFFDDHIKNSIKQYQDFGIKVYDINQETDFKLLKKEIKNKLVCFVGNSGVGKSTLINKIDKNMQIKTQAISQALNRGKHTTTTTTIYNFCDGKIADSPGYSSIEINLDKKDFAAIFFKSNKYHLHCKFADCLHLQEIGCAVKNQIVEDKLLAWRYDNYLKLLKGVK